jgi:hypothetical protein
MESPRGQIIFFHFESVATINQWRETEKAMFLASHLIGLALEALADMTPEARKVYSSILEHFEERFGDTAKVPEVTVKQSAVWDSSFNAWYPTSTLSFRTGTGGLGSGCVP